MIILIWIAIFTIFIGSFLLILICHSRLDNFFDELMRLNKRIDQLYEEQNTVYFIKDSDFKWKNKSRKYWNKILKSPRKDKIQYEPR
jgi:hypothetical protein